LQLVAVHRFQQLAEMAAKDLPQIRIQAVQAPAPAERAMAATAEQEPQTQQVDLRWFTVAEAEAEMRRLPAKQVAEVAALAVVAQVALAVLSARLAQQMLAAVAVAEAATKLAVALEEQVVPAVLA
jgi:hypothetical protein